MKRIPNVPLVTARMACLKCDQDAPGNRDAPTGLVPSGGWHQPSSFFTAGNGAAFHVNEGEAPL